MPFSRRLFSTASCQPTALSFLFACVLMALGFIFSQQRANAQVEFFDGNDDLSEDAETEAVAVPAPPEVKAIEDLFAGALAKHDLKKGQRIEVLASGYAKALVRLQDKASAAGNLELAVVIRNETKRAAIELAPRAEGESKFTDAELRELHEKFEKALGALDVEFSPSLMKLHHTRANLLRTKIDELTKAGKIDAALKAKQFLDSVEWKVPLPPLPKGYDAFYSFDSAPADGSTVEDQSPSGLRGTSIDPGWVAAGRRGGGHQITRLKQHLRLAPSPPFSESAFTVSLWVNLNEHRKTARLWDRLKGKSKSGYACSLEKGKPIFSYYDRGGNRQEVRCSKMLGLNEWHHLTFTYDSIRCVIYINGAVAKEDESEPLVAGQFQALVGTEASDGTFTLEGTIDDLIHYPRALSRKEVAELFKAVSALGDT